MASKFLTAVVLVMTGMSAAIAQTNGNFVAPPASDCYGAQQGVTDATTKLSDANMAEANATGAAQKAAAAKNVKLWTDQLKAASDKATKYCANAQGLGQCSSANHDFAQAVADMRKDCKIGDCMDFAQCSAEDLKGVNPSSSTAADDARKTCSALAGRDLDKLNDQLQKDKDHLKDLKATADQNAKDSSSGAKDTTQAINDARKEMAQNQDDSQKNIAEIQKTTSQEMKDLTQSIAEIQNHIDDLNGQLGQQDLTAAQAYANASKAKLQARMECERQASDQVSKLQDQILPQLKTGTYNLGGINALMNNVGLSDRQSWQRVAFKYYTYCISSAMTIANFDAADMDLALAKLSEQKAKQTINAQIRTAQGQIMLKDNGAGCGVTTATPTEKCQDLMQAQQQMQQESQSLQTKNAAVAQNIASLQQQGMQDQMQKMQAGQGSQQEYDDEKKRTDNLQALIDAKMAAGGNLDVPAKDLNKNYNEFQAAKTAANFAVGCAPQNGDPNCEDDTCKAAKKFIEETGITATYKNANRYDQSTFSSGSSDSGSSSGQGSSLGTGGAK